MFFDSKKDEQIKALKRRCETLENQNKTLQNEAILKLLDKLGEPDEIKYLRKQNRKYRLKIKELKQLLNEKGTKR